MFPRDDGLDLLIRVSMWISYQARVQGISYDAYQLYAEFFILMKCVNIPSVYIKSKFLIKHQSIFFLQNHINKIIIVTHVII